jgi:hypothetical protein
MREVIGRSARLVVMTEGARAILRDMYRVSPARTGQRTAGVISRSAGDAAAR